MAGRLLIPGWSRALDSDGDPISARISLFLTGTDDLAPVYSNEALTIPITNPVESNSAGRFPAIWADDAVTYDWSVEAPYGPPGSPFTGIGLTTALAADVLAAEAAEAAAVEAEANAAQTAADLAAIQAIEAEGSTAPAIAGKADRDGSNILGAQQLAFRQAIGADLAANVNFTPAGTGGVPESVQSLAGRVVYSDQYATVQEAITVAGSGGTVVFRSGGTTTLTAPLLLAGLSDVTLMGDGHTMRSDGTRISGYIDCSGSSNVVIQGFAFDGRQPSMPVFTQVDYAVGQSALVYNTPVFANGSWSNLTVRNCTMTDLYTNVVYAYQGTGLTVEGCKFSAPVCNQTYTGTPGAQQYSFIYVLGVAGSVRVVNNDFNGAAITNPALGVNAVFYSGTTGDVYIAGNSTNYCGRDNTGTHRLGVFDGYGDSVNVVVDGNTCLNTMAQFERMSATKSGKIINNVVRWSANAESGYNALSVEGSIAFGGQKGCEDILVQGNTLDDPSRRHAVAIALLAYDYGAPLRNIRVIDNVMTKAGMVVNVAGPRDGVWVQGNACPDYTTAFVNVSPAPGGVTLTTTLGTEANGVYDNLFIRGNSGRDLSAGASNGVQHNMNTFTASKVGYSEITGNKFEAAAGFAGVVLLGHSTDTSRNLIVVRDNRFVGHSYYFYPRDGGYYFIENNNCTGATTAPILDGGGYLGMRRSGNRFTVPGVLSGTATLVAGTVTVSNAEIQTGDTVRISRLTPGGTLGELSAPSASIVNGTSFVINSSNAADTSVVFWEIVH